MRYYSHLDNTINAAFKEALLASLAPGGGLWMPETLPQFTQDELARLGGMDFADCAAELAAYFTDDNFTKTDLTSICRDAYNFDIPLKSFDGYILDPALEEPRSEFMLELFHGPTLAFKDFAARFMGRAASHIMNQTEERRRILVATSGDTGGAIGDSFLHQDGIDVFILFPDGGVSPVQQQQLTTIGHGLSNVHAIAVKGSFDDCQQLVKDAFSDKRLSQKHKLMSANSINVGRVIPQSFYYFWTSLKLKAAYFDKKIVYSIPSGNLGNLTGGLIARKMGAPIDRFVIGNNINNPFVDYLKTAKYTPRPSVPTLSNAMDIGRPNNFPRILSLFNNDYQAVENLCWGASFSDEDTERHLRKIHAETGYIMCPHTAVGHLAMNSFAEGIEEDFIKVTVATAHPAKFKESVERIIRESIPMPTALQDIMTRTPKLENIGPDLSELTALLDAHNS